MSTLLKISLITFSSLCSLAYRAGAQSPVFLTGQKTGNLYQGGALLNLGTGNAVVSSPMTAHLGLLNALRFYYGDNILNDNAVASPSTVRASRTLNILNAISAGADAYIQFRNNGNLDLAAGTTTYFKLGTAPTVTGLSANVGGLLGLSNVYNISGRGYVNADNYVLGNSYNEKAGTPAGSANGTATKLLLDKTGTWFASVTPDASFNSVRLNVAFDQAIDLVDLSRDLSVKVYNSFYYPLPDSVNCGLPAFTSPGEVQGVSLNLAAATPLLALDSAVSEPWKAIDQSEASYSRITSGALGIATTVSQTIYFNGGGTTNDIIKVKMSLPQSALTAAILSNVTVKAFYNDQQVGVTKSLSDLLALDVLGLLGDNTPFDINYKPGGHFNKVQISLQNLVNIGANLLGGGVRVYEVVRVAQAPVISAQPANTTICLKSNAVFTATASGTNLSYSWEYYDGSNWIATGTNSNQLSVTNPALALSGRKYRVKVTGGYCASSQATITSSEAQLTINSLPTAPMVGMGP